MAYLFHSSPRTRDNLEYKLEGGDLSLAIEGQKNAEGRPINGADLGTFLLLSLPVPSQLMAAVPTRIVVKPHTGGLVPDFGRAATLYSWVVSERFVELVERLEPNVHQFLPIRESVARHGTPIGRAFFLMNVLVRLEPIDFEHSNVEWKTMRFSDQTEITMPELSFPFKLALRRDLIERHHLWQGGKNGLMGSYYMSERLHDEMAKAHLSPLSFRKCEEV
jgi:hypothetical protein